MPIEQRINWHRWFGIGLTDRLADMPWRVELEKDLALTIQRLDVVIIERNHAEAPPAAAALDLLDGLDILLAHNLLT